MTVTMTDVETLDDPSEYSDLLREYLRPHIGQLRDACGVSVDLERVVAMTVDNIDRYLPPEGALWLARDETGRLVATICLKMIRSNAAEIKRLYVRPEARGQGLAKALVKAALERSKTLGASKVFIDTGNWQTPAIKLYEKLGFDFVDRYPESENPEEMHPHLVYMRKSLAA